MPNKIEKRPDGNLHIEYETGEIFDGDPLEVTAKMAEAHVNTKHWGQEWKAKAEALPAQPPPPPQQPVNVQEEETRKWVAAQAAQGLLGVSPEEIRNKWQELEKFKEQTQTNWAVTQFYQMHPEYPGTQEANDQIGKIFEENGWNLTAGNLEAAHLIAVQRKLYQPINPQQQQTGNPAPPPMLHTGNPEQQLNQGGDPYAMKLDELRRLAIQQQLGGNR